MKFECEYTNGEFQQEKWPRVDPYQALIDGEGKPCDFQVQSQKAQRFQEGIIGSFEGKGIFVKNLHAF